MELLERQNFIDELKLLAKDVACGSGKTVLVSGEAGVGKTTLIKFFTGGFNPGAEILWGACDDLFTPRPLGPVYDIALQVKSLISDRLNLTNRNEIFTLLFNYLQKGSNLKVFVIEDIHWADEATLDLIKFLTRRIGRTKTILVLSYRDEELGHNNRLRSVFADLPYSEIKRIRLYPLSEKAVNELMKNAGVYNSSLYGITGGNPFYVSEMLAYRNDEIPLSIKDAVVSRVASLDAESKNLLEIISVIPTKSEIELLGKLSGRVEECLDRCIEKGILTADKNLVSYRHELARLAVLNSLPERKRIQLHYKVLECLLEKKEKQDFLARIMHHAVQSNEKDKIIEYAPIAAKQASSLGAHQLACEHYSHALKFAEELSPEKKIVLLEDRSYEYYLTGQIKEALKDGGDAAAILQEYPDPEREGEIYRRMSRMLWYDCEDIKGEEYLDKAIKILEKIPHGRSLAMAYSNKSQTYMIREQNEPAIFWGKKALELAAEIQDTEIEAHALNNLGSSLYSTDEMAGEEHLKKSIEISLKNDYCEQAIRGLLNLGGLKLESRNLSEADYYYTKGTEYINEKDLYVFGLCLAGHHAKVKMQFGNWFEAVEIAEMVLNKGNVPPGNSLLPGLILGQIRGRRNDPGAAKLLENNWELVMKLGELEKIVIAASAMAEYYWLQNRLESFADELKSVLKMTINSKKEWTTGEIAYWLWKAGELEEIPERIARVYLLQIKGDWSSAAGLWEKLHCPYEQALALSEGDEVSMKKSIEIFEGLGAAAASSLIRQKMRESGIKKVPKGPREATRNNPAGLTGRQLDVLRLVTKGLSNSEIASNLFISPKTVDHHISAILAKLNLRSRNEAASYVRENRILGSL